MKHTFGCSSEQIRDKKALKLLKEGKTIKYVYNPARWKYWREIEVIVK